MDDSARFATRLVLSGQRPPRVIVLSRVRFYREGLEQLLAEGGGFEVGAALAPDAEAIDRVLEEPPDVVLVDISSSEGIAALRALGDRTPEIRTVAAAVSGDDTEILECAQAGAAGYVTADASLQELQSILRSVAQGELRCLPLAASVLRRRLASVATQGGGPDGDASLTAREVEIARLLGQNLANKEIAQRLNIAVSTVKSHVHSILEKLHVDRRTEAVARLGIRRLPSAAGTAVQLSGGFR